MQAVGRSGGAQEGGRGRAGAGAAGGTAGNVEIAIRIRGQNISANQRGKGAGVLLGAGCCWTRAVTVQR